MANFLTIRGETSWFDSVGAAHPGKYPAGAEGVDPEAEHVKDMVDGKLQQPLAQLGPLHGPAQKAIDARDVGRHGKRAARKKIDRQIVLELEPRITQGLGNPPGAFRIGQAQLLDVLLGVDRVIGHHQGPLVLALGHAHLAAEVPGPHHGVTGILGNRVPPVLFGGPLHVRKALFRILVSVGHRVARVARVEPGAHGPHRNPVGTLAGKKSVHPLLACHSILSQVHGYPPAAVRPLW